MMYNEIPHGKQNWYVQNSGIWQGVRLELCPEHLHRAAGCHAGQTEKFAIEARLAGVGLTAESERDPHRKPGCKQPFTTAPGVVSFNASKASEISHRTASSRVSHPPIASLVPRESTLYVVEAEP